MPTRIETLDDVPEGNLVETIALFSVSAADIVTAVNDNHGKFTVEATFFGGTPAGSPLLFQGKMSVFGGADDGGVTPDEGLALFEPEDVDANPDLFGPQPPDTTGLARRLKADALYLACRWDYDVTPKSYLKKSDTLAKITNPANGQSKTARPADFGPAIATGRVTDLSPKLAQALGLNTDDECKVEIAPPPGAQSPAPTAGVATGVDPSIFDSTIFTGNPGDIRRKLVVMTTADKATYWVVNRVGQQEGGQSLVRRKDNANTVLLSDSTVFPVQASADVPAAVADELNKAAPRTTSSGEEGPGGTVPGTDDEAAAKMFQSAKDFLGHDTGHVPGTDNGNLACAWAVNEVARLALGKPISSDGGNNGLSTVGLFAALKAKHKQINAASDAAPGTIIIAPTKGAKHGHVGIVGKTTAGVNETAVFSNSSSGRKFAQNYTIKKFTDRYAALGLEVLYFALKKDQF